MSDLHCDTRHVIFEGEQALGRLQRARLSDQVSTSDLHALVRYGAHLRHAGAFVHALAVWEVLLRHAAGSSATSAFSAVSARACRRCLGVASATADADLQEIAEWHLQRAFTDSLPENDFELFLLAEALVSNTIEIADGYARIGDSVVAISLCEQALLLLASHATAFQTFAHADLHTKPLYRRLSLWHARRGNAAVAATFEARLAAAVGANDEAHQSIELAIPHDDPPFAAVDAVAPPAPLAFRPIARTESPGGSSGSSGGSSSDDKPLSRKRAAVLCRPTARRAVVSPDAKKVHAPAGDVVSELMPLLAVMCRGQVDDAD